MEVINENTLPVFCVFFSATCALLLIIVSAGCSPDETSPDSDSSSSSETLSLASLNDFDFKAHDPSRLVEVAPGVLAFVTTTDSSDQNQNAALKIFHYDVGTGTGTWKVWQTWTWGVAIPGVEEWHLPWMMDYGYEPFDGFDDFHKELAVVAPSFYRKDIIYFSLWNEPGAVQASENGKEGAMYRGIYRATSEGEWPNQSWRMEALPVYYSDDQTFDAGMPRGIDVHVWDDTDGETYMTFGSWDPEGHPVIALVPIDEETGRIVGVPPGEPGYHSNVRQVLHPLATFGEAAFSYRHKDWYYLFLNLGSCCSGVESTYAIVAGRSRSVYGPYRDRDGDSFLDEFDYEQADFPGTPVLSGEGRFIGPGHAGILEHTNGKLYLSFHYYDGEDEGLSRFGLRELTFDDEGWPVVLPSSN